MTTPLVDGIGLVCASNLATYTPPVGFGVSEDNPFPTASGSFDINSTTGVFGYYPVLTGSSYFALLCREYRGGVLISETVRDGQIIVIDCPPNPDITVENWTESGSPSLDVFRDGATCHEFEVNTVEPITDVLIPNLPEHFSYSVTGVGSTNATVEVCIDYGRIDANCEDLSLDFDVVAQVGTCFASDVGTKNLEVTIGEVGYCKTNRFFTNRNAESGVLFPTYAIASERIWVGDDMPGISGIPPAEMGHVEINEDFTLVAGIEVIIPACVTGTGCVTFGGVNQTIIIAPNTCDEECPYDPLEFDVKKLFECGEEKVASYVYSGVPPYSYIWKDGAGELLSTSSVLDVHEIVSELYWDTPFELSLQIEDAGGAIGEWSGEINGTKRFYEPVTDNTIWFDYPEDHLMEDGYYYAGQPGVDLERPFFIADSVNTSPPWYGATEIELIVWDRWDAGMGEPGETIHATFYTNSWNINGTNDWSLDNGEVYWNGHWGNDPDGDCPGSSPEIWVYQIVARNCLTPAEEPDDWRHVEISPLVKFNCFDGDWTPSIDVTMAPLNGEDELSANRDVNWDMSISGLDSYDKGNYILAPNPASDNLFILGELDKITSIQIYDLTGSLVKDFDENFTLLNIDDISSGSYIVQINTHENSYFSELIIQ